MFRIRNEIIGLLVFSVGYYLLQCANGFSNIAMIFLFGVWSIYALYWGLRCRREKREQDKSCKLSVWPYLDLREVPVSEWEVEWFYQITNIELKRQFIRERGAEIYSVLQHRYTVDSDEEYELVSFKFSNLYHEVENRALVYKCPSSGDTYFTAVDPTISSVQTAVKFLNDRIGKEEFAYES